MLITLDRALYSVRQFHDGQHHHAHLDQMSTSRLAEITCRHFTHVLVLVAVMTRVWWEAVPPSCQLQTGKVQAYLHENQILCLVVDAGMLSTTGSSA
jgi:hypothetical protein